MGIAAADCTRRRQEMETKMVLPLNGFGGHPFSLFIFDFMSFYVTAGACEGKMPRMTQHGP